MTASLYTLKDVEAEAAAHPKTFKIPTLEDRRALQAGHLAKLIFVPLSPVGACTGERMWVRIRAVIDAVVNPASRARPPLYVGELENEPQVIDGLAYGDNVLFGLEHIAEIQFATREFDA